MSDYAAFLASKRYDSPRSDLADAQVYPWLYPFQQAIVEWAVRLGRAAVFAECGLGKTRIQLAWAHELVRQTGQRALILAPLAVTRQTAEEAARVGVPCVVAREQADIGPAITVTNYERLSHFDPAAFGAVVLDESGILKSFMGATKRRLIEVFGRTPYRLCCTATPAPNDHMELGNHAQFLGVMASNEMLARWFINDTMEAGAYRLKRHAEQDYWRWVHAWAVSCVRPSDLGAEFSDEGYTLPDLAWEHHTVAVPTVVGKDSLFPEVTMSATTMHDEMRRTAPMRAAAVGEIIRSTGGRWIVWCHTDYEADALKAQLPAAVEVRGSQKLEDKERGLDAFLSGRVDVLIGKPSMFGFGLNLQFCSQVAFVGLSYSYESLYQAIRRCWRFGQTKPVRAVVVTAETERVVLATIERKMADHRAMQVAMVTAMQDTGVIHGGSAMYALRDSGAIEQASGDHWTLSRGDAVRVFGTMPADTVHLSVFSPPFSNLYIYSDFREDMGNSGNHDEFFAHYAFLAAELLRVTLPGRICAIHCKDLPLYKGRDGAAGLFDFPGRIIRTMQATGWTFHSRVTIWKDPVTEMQRTKNHGLLYKQLRKDSSASRQGMADYVLAFRKWVDGLDEFPEPVSHERANFPLEQWQAWASPVWSDINQMRVLQYRSARGDEDERHICPLQLDVIERCIRLWSNPGDLVADPFTGVGSTGYEAVRQGRRFVGSELKPEYFAAAIRHLREMESIVLAQGSLFMETEDNN